ncbi:hypothetical protein [Schaalia suimastitidis]|uniref:hypothetical protein n=1 Tax=Schaalia suimastitidis TaxID=121163 RepID=UPI00040D1A50|nr:hypothetical protein [Schaalia suimastitidis]
MALFEFEDGRLIPAQFGRNVPGGLTPEVIDAVCSQVLEIVSRPLFPITWRDLSPVDDGQLAEPRLIALDASGQVVSVEVVRHLDSDILISSLSRLAQTAALSWSDLAREYPGDVDGFKLGWLRFKDSMPPSAGSGPRLVIVVASIDPAVRPALDVLAASGVEVHEMAFRQMSNGRTFLEVSTVGPRMYGHAPQVVVGRSTQTGQIEAVAQEQLTSDVTLPTLGVTPSAVDTLPHVSDEAVPLAAQHEQQAGAQDSAPDSSSLVAATSNDAAAADEAFNEAPAANDEVAIATPANTVPPYGPYEATGAARYAPVHTPPRPRRPIKMQPVKDEAIVGDGVDAVTGVGIGEHSVAAEVDADVASHSAVDRGPLKDRIEQARNEGVPVVDRDAQGLHALAAVIGGDVPLVAKPSAHLPDSFVLGADGNLYLNGMAFTSPQEAMSHLGVANEDAGAPEVAWHLLHILDLQGPTLDEALDEVNRDIIREYADPTWRQHRSKH